MLIADTSGKDSVASSAVYLEIAEGYEKLATLIEQRTADKEP